MSFDQPSGAVDGVEQPSTHHDRAAGRRRSFEDLGVDRVLFEDPRVELGGISEPVFNVGAGPVTYPSSDMVMSAMTFGMAHSSHWGGAQRQSDSSGASRNDWC